MHWQYNHYVLLLIISAAISAALALFVWRRRPAPGATVSVLLLLAVAEWLLAYTFELGSVDLPSKLFWGKVAYLGIVTVPLAWFAFVLQYTGREKWLTRCNVALLAIVPLVTLLLIWTNDLHRLFYTHARLDTSGPLSVLDLTYGVWFWVDVVYSYLLILPGTLLLLQALVRSSRLYAGQASVLLIGAFAPWVAEVLFISGLSPFSPLDLTPFAFTLTGLTMTWGFFRFRLVVLRDITRHKRAETRLRLLYEAAVTAMTSVHLDEILHHTIVALQEMLQPDDVAILLVEPETNELVIRAHAGFPGRPELMRRAIGVGIPGWVVQTGEPVLLDDVRGDERYHGCDPGTLSELCVPLRVGERIIGAINLESRRLAFFSEEDLRLVSTLTGHLTTVIENAHLFEKTEHLKVFNEGIVQGVAEALCIEDADGIITFVNPAMEELLGYTADELVGQHWRIIAPPEEVGRIQEKTSRRPACASERYETRLWAKDGREIPVLVSARSRFEDGEFTGVLVAFRDITERKVLEGMWRRYEFIVNTSREFMALISRDYVYQTANESYCRAHNKTREEIFDRTVAKVWGQQVFDTIVKQYLDQCFAGDIVHYARWFDFSALGWRYMDVTYYPYYGHPGSVTHAVVVSRDITGRKRAEEALELRNRELTVLYQAATAVSSDLSLDVVLRAVAEHMTQALDSSECVLLLWDRERSLVVTLVDYSAVCPNETDAVCTTHDLSDYPAMRRVLETRQPIVIRRGDPVAGEPELAWMGKEEILALLILPLIVHDQVLGLVELFTQAPDYTPEEIRLAQSLAAQAAIAIENARLYEQAQQEITERGRAEKALRQRTAQLEAINEELEAFAYSVSHDLRAPLRSVDGFSLILLEDYADKLDVDGQDYLRRVRSASQRMAQLIEDILRLSRITRREMRRQVVDLSALAREVAIEIEQREPNRQVQFVIEEGVIADGDAHLLRVVLENLLGNAWKYTSKHPRARIEFGVTQHDGKVAYFVRDDGAGFDMAYADRLFNAFHRLHSATEFEGTGIGLATTQRIVHLHGGRIWAQGAVEQGATFYFTL